MRYLLTIFLTLVIWSGVFAGPAKIKMHDKAPPGHRNRDMQAWMDTTGVSLYGWQGEAYLHIGMPEGLAQYADSMVFSERDGNRSVQLWSEFFYYENYVRSDSSFEWEMILPNKLAGNHNSVTFPFDSRGLKFSYQPELTQVEIDSGYFRPDSVVGSYSVDLIEGWGNGIITKTGVMNFGDGKFTHIYRPKAIDANGDTVWCDIFIDTVMNTITISLPTNYLKTASYPVIIDPTFGNTLIGGTATSGLPPVTLGSRFYMSGQSGTIDSFHVYSIGSLLGTPVMGMSIYGDSSSTIKNFVDSSATTIGWTDTDGEWIDYDAGEGGTLKADSTYFLGTVYSSGTSTNAKLFYDNIDIGNGWSSSDSWPPDAPSPTVSNTSLRRHSMYVTYTEDAAPTPSTFPDDWSYHCAIVVQASQTDAAFSGFVAVLNEDNFPAGMMDPANDSVAQNGGGDIRFTSDSAGSNQIPVDPESFEIHTASGGRVAEIYVLFDVTDVTNADTIWCWWGTTTHDSQPARTATYGSEAVWSGYLFVSHMNESSGDIIDETSGNYDFGTIGTPTYLSEGYFGTGILYTAGNKHARVNAAAFDALSGVTIMMWMRVIGNTGSNQGRAFTNGLGSTGDAYYLGANFDDERRRARFRNTSSTSHDLEGQAGNFMAGDTYEHSAMTWGGTTLTVYDNGAVDSTETTSGTMADPASTDSLGIGGHPRDGTNTRHFRGQLDNIRVDDFTWPTTWISTVYNNESSPSTFFIEGAILAAPGAPSSGGGWQGQVIPVTIQ